MKKRLLLLLTSCFFLLTGITLPQNQFWLRDVSKQIGLDSAWGTRIVIVDVNGDDYPDLLWGTGNIAKNKYYLYLNIENPDKLSPYHRIFKDITAESGINVNRNPLKTGRVVDIASMADVDNDGDMDLVTSIYYHRLENYLDTLDPGDRSEVYLNDGTGKFTLMPANGLYDMTVLSWLPKGLINTSGLSFLDYDLDGKIDLYFATWFGDRTKGIGMPDLLFKGNGDGSFTNTNMKIFTDNYYPMYGVNATDWDNDGWPDILTSPYCNSNSNLFRNMHDGTFQDYSSQANFNSTDMTGDNGQALCQWEAQPADYNNDGAMDILQVFVHGGYDAGEGRTRVLTNLGPDSGFKYKPDLNLIQRDAPANSHLGDQGGQWFDINGDGNMDIAIGQMAYPTANTQGQERLYICLQKPGQTPLFQDISKSIGIFSTIKEAHSMEPLDFDLDGDQDLLVSHQVRDTVWKDTVIGGITTKVVESTSAHMQITLLENKVSDADHLGSDYHRWISVKVNPPPDCNRSGIGTRIKVFANGKSYMQDIQSGLGHFAGQQQFIRNFGFGFVPVNIDSIEVNWPNKNHTKTVVRGVPLNTVVEINKDGYKGYKKTWNIKMPLIAVINSNLDFGKINVGQSKELNMVIDNPGETPLIIDSITSFASAGFSFSSPMKLPLTIQPGNRSEFAIKFQPEKRLEIRGDLIIRSNAFNDSLAKLHYYGYGFENQPIIASDNKDIDFGKIYTDSSATRDIVIKNIGEIDLSISQILTNGLPPELKILNIPDLPLIIKPNQTFNLKAEFKPGEETEYQAIVVLQSNAYNDDSYHINLKGTGETRKPQISVSTKTFLFGNVTINDSKVKGVKIKNIGTADLKINEIIFEKPFQSNYEFQFTLPYTILSGQESELNFIFKPTQIISYKTDVYVKSNSAMDSLLTLTFIGGGKDVIGEVDNKEQNGIIINPNPATGFVTISFPDSKDFINNIRLFDLIGNEHKIDFSELDNFNNKFYINTANLPSGIYILIISTNRDRFYNTLIVD